MVKHPNIAPSCAKPWRQKTLITWWWSYTLAGTSWTGAEIKETKWKRSEDILQADHVCCGASARHGIVHRHNAIPSSEGGKATKIPCSWNPWHGHCWQWAQDRFHKEVQLKGRSGSLRNLSPGAPLWENKHQPIYSHVNRVDATMTISSFLFPGFSLNTVYVKMVTIV